MQQTWTDVVQRAAVSGLVAGAATAVTAAVRGSHDSGSALAPINAASHVAWGDEAAYEERADFAHTVLGAVIHTSAGVFWASVYEKLFGERAERGDLAAAFGGGAFVAALAYLTDYHLVPKRLTPGWEHRISGRSLALTYTVLGVSLPLRALVAAGQKGRLSARPAGRNPRPRVRGA